MVHGKSSRDLFSTPNCPSSFQPLITSKKKCIFYFYCSNQARFRPKLREAVGERENDSFHGFFLSFLIIQTVLSGNAKSGNWVVQRRWRDTESQGETGRAGAVAGADAAAKGSYGEKSRRGGRLKGMENALLPVPGFI